MTKSLKLVLENSFYKIKGGKKRKIKIICSAAVNHILHTTPNKITLTVSNEPLEHSTQVFVTKNGFYRWYYYWKDFPVHGGIVSNEAEEILNKLFPKARTDGMDPNHPLWIQIIP